MGTGQPYIEPPTLALEAYFLYAKNAFIKQLKHKLRKVGVYTITYMKMNKKLRVHHALLLFMNSGFYQLAPFVKKL